MKRREAMKMGLVGVGIDGVLTGIDSKSSDKMPYSVSISNTDRVRGNSPLKYLFNITDNTLSENSPAEIQLSMTNTGDRTVEYITGSPKPFGVLLAGGETLWTDRYREDPGTNTKGREVIGGTDGGPSVVLRPDEEKTESYEFRGAPGKYTIREVGHPLEIHALVERSGDVFNMRDVYKPELHVTAES